MRLGDIRSALAVAEQGAVVAEAAKLPVGTVWAEWGVGNTQHFMGNQAAAQLHFERGMELAVEVGACSRDFPGFDPRIFSLVGLARTLWLRGFSGQALRFAQKALDEAASRDRPIPICISLVYTSTCLLWTGDLARAGDMIEQLLSEALAVARTQSALAWELRSTMVLARLLCQGGHCDQARQALALVKLARELLLELR